VLFIKNTDLINLIRLAVLYIKNPIVKLVITLVLHVSVALTGIIQNNDLYVNIVVQSFRIWICGP
jgi:hypothetical protein